MSSAQIITKYSAISVLQISLRRQHKWIERVVLPAKETSEFLKTQGYTGILVCCHIPGTSGIATAGAAGHMLGWV